VPEIPVRVAAHRSIFVKLLAIMVVMALCLMFMVTAFFAFIVNPGVEEAVDRVLEVYGDTVASRSPDFAEARTIAQRIGITIAYRGPQGAWTTDRERPDGWDDRGETPASLAVWAHGGHSAPARDGGTYFFAWKFGHTIRAAHDKLALFLLLLMVAVVVAAHEVLRRALRPVRLLYAGVARISDGDFDVAVPRQSRDELGALTDAFNQMARRVKEMIALRDQLLLDVSHELRSPLTRMKVALALVPEGEKRRRMEADVAEMEAMITSILELERLRDGRGVRLERRDIVPIVREVAMQFRGVPPGVDVTTPSTAVELEIDAERIRTLLRNLLDNAVKYRLPDSRPVTVTVEGRPDALVLRVSDDGPGIAPSDLGNIFEPFYRADHSRSKKTGGYGLGLSMCRRIVEAHGGTISAQHNPGRGATMVATFPRRA
jgi:signal transduction histidine kinase